MLKVGRSERRRWRHARSPLVIACTALLLMPLLVACSLGQKPTPTPLPTPTLGLPPGIGTPSINGTPAFTLPSGNDVKIDSTLLDVATAYRQGGRPAAEQKARETGLLNDKNEVRLTLILSNNNTQPVVDKVKSIGGKVGSVVDNMIDVLMPLDVLINYVSANGQNAVQELAAFDTVTEVQVTRRATPEGFDFPPGMTIDQIQPYVAQMIVEGVAVSGADKWQAAGITGKGVKVGIIDGGFEGYEALLGKELPQKVGFKSFTSDGGVGDGVHGTAVTEIVHAMAPDAEIILTPFDTEADFARALRYLVDDAKVQVLQMSFGWHNTRGDGQGFTQDEINYARSKGVLPVKSAGNEGDSHYTATFNPDSNGRQQFGPGKTRIQVGGTDGQILLYLIWDAWSGAPVNYDLFVVDEAGNKVASSRNVQGPSKRPFEQIYYEGRANTKYYAVIEAVGQQPAVRLDLFGKNTPVEQVTSGSTPATSISAPGDAQGAFTVGAVNFKDDKLEGYSSQGPTLDGRRKPDISGLARVTTTAYAGDPFYGTSAACPHVSGAAALVFSAQPGATANQVQDFLEKNAKDIEAPGPESKSGFGRLAMGPVENARTPAPSSAPVGGPSAAPFSDPFTDPNSGLPNGGEGAYGNGRYTMTPNAANRAVWAAYSPTYANATVEATVQVGGGAPGTAGLIFWQTGADDYHLFAITADGYYQISRYQRGKWTSIVPWTKNPAIAANGPNALKVQTNGPQISASINGQALPPATATTAGRGRVGLLAATFAQPGTTATFAEFKVTPAP